MELDLMSAQSQEGAYGNVSLSLLVDAATVPPGPPQTEATLSPVQAPLSVHYSVTMIVTVLVGILFLSVYVQLIMVICFGYKLLTYQTILLFDILLWAALRLTLYSFYFYHCCELVTRIMGTFEGWLLVSFPSFLQYVSLAVLVHYFGESIFKVLKKRQEMASLVPPYKRMRKYRVCGEFMWAVSLVFFLTCSLTLYFLIEHFTGKARSILVVLRVALLDGLFLIMGITLGICIIIIYITRVGKDVLEAQGGRKCIPPLTSFLLILIFASRDIYSLVAAISDSDDLFLSDYWVFVTDEGPGDYNKHRDISNAKYGYIAYFLVLLVWEVMPTYIIVLFFRVRIPRNHSNSLRIQFKPCKSRRKRGKTTPTNQRHFFENPNRYDENEQLLYPPVQRQPSSTSHVSIPSLTGSTHPHPTVHPYAQQHHHHTSSGGYGSTTASSALRPTPYQQPSKNHSINYQGNGNSSHPYPAHGSVMPGTTPPKLFTSPSFFTDR